MRRAIFTLLLLGLPGAVSAQNQGVALFVEGSVLGDRDTTHRLESSMTLGGSGTIGVQLTRHFSIRFDGEVPAFHTRTSTTFAPGVFRSEDTVSFRTQTYAVLFGGHVHAHEKVDLAFLGGFSGAVAETHQSGFSESLAKDGSAVHRYDDTYDHASQHNAITLGIDAAVRLTAHVAIVPELRWHVYNIYGIDTRPKLAVRWTF